MALKVFISYSAQSDQVIALRLQTLVSVYGFEAFAPPAYTRQRDGLLSHEIQQAITSSDVFLAVVTTAPSHAAIAEVEYARGCNKLIIPIVGPAVDRNFLQAFPHAFVLDPLNPARVEADIVEFLKKSQAEKETRNLLIGLAALTVGLLLLSSESN